MGLQVRPARGRGEAAPPGLAGARDPARAERWKVFADQGDSPAESAESREVLGSIGRALESELSPHQREVLVAVALNGVPIDVLAERLGSTRGALYKTIHDARKKLRAHLAEAGLRFEADGARGARRRMR